MKETENKIIIQSEVDNFYRYLLIVGFLFFGWLCYLTRSALYEEPIELIFLIVFLVFACFGLLSLIGFWSYYSTIKIFADKLEIENYGGLLKKSIYFNDIAETRTVHKKGQYDSWDELTIVYGNKQKYKIYSTSYKNFNTIEGFLASKSRRSLNKNAIAKDKSKIRDTIIIVLMLILGLLGIWYFYKQGEDYQLDRNELANIELTLDSKPTIVNGSKGSKSLEIKIREYPNFRFNLSGIAYSATNTSNFIENTEGGSRITLTVDKEDYLQKLTKSKEATFWIKHVNYKHISIYGIKDDKQSYLTILNYEKNNKNDSKWGIFGIIGIFLYIGYVTWKERDKKR